MRYSWRRIFALSLLILVVFAGNSQVYSTSDRVGIIVNGIKIDADPIIKNGRTLLPIRAVSEELGYSVNWDGVRREVSISNGEKNLLLKIDDSRSYVDGRELLLDVPAMIKTGTTYVPVRFVASAMGMDVVWNSSTRLVYLKDPKSENKNETDRYLGYKQDDLLDRVKDSILNRKTIIELDNIEKPEHLLERFNREYGYLNYMNSGISYTLNSKREYTKLDLRLKDEDFKKIEMVDRKADEIIRSLDLDGKSDFQKVYEIHNYIVNNTQYAYGDYLSNKVGDDKYNSYGVLIKGLGVCDGYAKSFQLLSHKAGVQAVYVSGIANNGKVTESHAWNKVKLDGDWYIVDTTWDDPVSSKPILRYDYFLKSDKELPRHKESISIDYPKASKKIDAFSKIK